MEKELEETSQRSEKCAKKFNSNKKEQKERELPPSQKEQSLNEVKMLNKTDLYDREVNVYLWFKQFENEAVDLLHYAQIFFDNHINGKAIQMLATQDLF